MKTFNDLAAVLPFADFMRLQRQMTNPETKTYIRTITGAVKVPRGQHGSAVGKVTYEPVPGGQFEDSGEIQTNWLNDPVSTMICQTAKEVAGQRCVIFQLNKDKSEAQPSGFRECIWLEPLTNDTAPSSTTRQEATGPNPVTSSPPVQKHDEPFQPTVAEHLGEPPPVEYHEEPF